MKNLTPAHMRCEWGACPAVYELDDGRLLIRGANAHLTLATWQLPDGKDNMPSECDIIIDRALLADVLATPGEEREENA